MKTSNPFQNARDWGLRAHHRPETPGGTAAQNHGFRGVEAPAGATCAPSLGSPAEPQAECRPAKIKGRRGLGSWACTSVSLPTWSQVGPDGDCCRKPPTPPHPEFLGQWEGKYAQSSLLLGGGLPSGTLFSEPVSPGEMAVGESSPPAGFLSHINGG